jgi:hypothetical protein
VAPVTTCIASAAVSSTPLPAAPTVAEVRVEK